MEDYYEMDEEELRKVFGNWTIFSEDGTLLVRLFGTSLWAATNYCDAYSLVRGETIVVCDKDDDEVWQSTVEP